MKPKIFHKNIPYRDIPSNPVVLKPLVRYLTWLNIGVQVLFPLASVFTPTVVAASDKTTTDYNVIPQSRTVPWVLEPNESVSDVALRYNLSVAALKNLNQFRTFSKPFEQLTTGDEIDVPASSVTKDMRNVGNVSSPEQTAEVGRWISANAVGLAKSTTGPHHAQLGDVAMSQARSAAVSESSAAVDQWLSHFGTAQVQLGVDDHFSLNESALDLLVPLYDNGGNVLFIQAGGRRHDGRTTLNVGSGVRLFRGNWMYGTNAFLDNDITGHNRRVGFGAEAWTDYLKLSANSYFAITGWHQSRDFEDYDERPANGFDIAANAWLPAYPQLGGTLKYEQYQGEHVGLMGKDTLQKNPKALTAGLNWTPVPLVTLGTDYRNSAGEDEIQMQAEFTWTFGESLADQMSGDKVGQSRTLAGSRLDLVERNNNIVLDYRKQEVVRLSLPDNLHGRSLSQQLINATVTAKHGVATIEWSAPELTAAGGKMTSVGLQGLQVQLPAFQPSGVNQYVVHARAKDTRGNYSPDAQTTITVDSATVSATNSVVTLSLSNLPANGVATSLITLKVRDTQNAPVQGIGSSIVLPFTFKPFTTAMNASPTTGGQVWSMLTGSVISQAMAETPASTASGGVKISQIRETQPGVYEAILTAGTAAGTVTVTPHVAEVTLSPKSLEQGFGSDAYSLGNMILPTVNPKADGVPVPVNIPVSTPDGKPVVNHKVTISVNGAVQTVTTDNKGNALVNVAGQTTPGDYSVQITLNGHTQKETLHFEAVPNIAGLTFDSAPKEISIAANGVETGHLTFRVLDAQRKGKGGEVVHVTLGGKAFSDITTNATGDATVQFAPSSVAGDVQVVASLDNGTHQTVTIHYVTPTQAQLTASVIAANSTLSVSPASIAADDSAESTVTFTAKDAQSKPVKGLTEASVGFIATTTLGSADYSVTGFSESNGVYTVKVKGSKPGSISLNAASGFGMTNVAVTLRTPVSALSTLRFDQSGAAVAQGGTSDLTFTAKDRYGRPISGLASSLVMTTSMNGVTFSQAMESPPASGVYVMSVLAGTSTGSGTIDAVVDGVKISTPFGVLPSVFNPLTITNNLLKVDGSNSTEICLTLLKVGISSSLKAGGSYMTATPVIEKTPGVYCSTMTAESTAIAGGRGSTVEIRWVTPGNYYNQTPIPGAGSKVVNFEN